MDTQSGYDDSRIWCGDNGGQPMTKRSLTRRLEERGVKRGGNGRGFDVGVQLASTPADLLATAAATVVI